jgi:hypothetical protein
MAKNKLEDVRNHLFMQLERLNDDELMKNPIKRDAELSKAKAIAEVSQVLVNSAKVEVDFIRAIDGITALQSPSDFMSAKQIDNK